MPIIPADDAPTFDMPGVHFTGLAAPSRGARETSVWLLAVDPRSPGVPHSVTREEIFVATAGRGEFHLDGQAHQLAPGDAAIVPPNVEFSVANPHDEPFHAVVVLPVGGEAVTSDGAFTPPWAA
jgi:quercetin dioxygenase-like cupin family protein